MSLRLRIALTLGLIAAAVSALSVGGSYAVTRAQLRSEVDQFLVTRSEDISRALTPGTGNRRPGFGTGDFDDLRPSPRLRDLYDLDAITQVIDGDGTIVGRVDTETALPIDDRDLALASTDQASILRTVEIDGDRYRMITAHVSPGVAVQIARGIEPNATVLARLSRQLLVLVGVGVTAAALAGWFFARRTTQSIERLDLSARRVAETQNLDQPVDIGGDSEVASLARSFNTMLEALRTSKEQQHRLVMDASHELRTPLTSLRTGIELLQRGDEVPPADRERLLANLTSELGELTDLVSELVELASDRASSTEPAVEETLETLARTVADRAEARTGRQVRTTVTDPTVVRMHPAMLERAIGNLVDNALKYSADSPIDVEVAGSVISVSDRGAGVADADKAQVFERFYRATDSRSMPGSGLGLSIVADIAAHHGATVAVADRPDGGATFSMTFPAADRSAAGVT